LYKEALQIAEERREVKGKGEKERWKRENENKLKCIIVNHEIQLNNHMYLFY